MVDILLTHAFFLENDKKQREEKFRPYPPLATLYSASLLRQTGLSVDLFDATLETKAEAFERKLEQCQPRLVAIYEDSFNFLSKMCLTHVRDASQRMVKQARNRNIPVIISSSDASDDPSHYLSCGVNFVMLGEADNTILELSQHILQGEPGEPGGIAGIAYYQDNNDKDCSITRTGRRSNLRNLDNLPFPAWDLLDIEAYRSAWREAHGMFSMNMVTTRGCPYACTWCAKPIWGKSYAVRTPANVAAEMAAIKSNYKPDHIWFADDIFGLKPGWVEQFADEVKIRNAATPFMIQSRADLMREDTVAALRDAGCMEVWMGAESGSQKVLDAMKKGITVEQIHMARRLLGDYGIRSCFFIQFGYPGESLEDIRDTVQLVRSALPDDIGVSVSYPLPGTEFYELVNHKLDGKRNWQESNDLDPMYQAAFNSSFYRDLSRYLHLDLEQRLGRRDRISPGDEKNAGNLLERLLVAEENRGAYPATTSTC